MESPHSAREPNTEHLSLTAVAPRPASGCARPAALRDVPPPHPVGPAALRAGRRLRSFTRPEDRRSGGAEAMLPEDSSGAAVLCRATSGCPTRGAPARPNVAGTSVPPEYWATGPEGRALGATLPSVGAALDGLANRRPRRVAAANRRGPEPSSPSAGPAFASRRWASFVSASGRFSRLTLLACDPAPSRLGRALAWEGESGAS